LHEGFEEENLIFRKSSSSDYRQKRNFQIYGVP